MASLKNFTSLLTVFCILVFSYFFIPDTYGLLISFIKYIIIVLSIVILMIYYNLIGDLSLKTFDYNDNNALQKDIKVELTREI